MLLGGALILSFSMAVMPVNVVFAIQQQLSPRPGTASQVTLLPGPGLRQARKRTIEVKGLSSENYLAVNHAEVRLGSRLIPLYGTIVYWDRDSFHISQQLSFLYNEDIGDLSQPVTFDYALTMLAPTKVAIPVRGGNQFVPGIGRCYAGPNDDHTQIVLDCLEPAKMPSCYSVILELPDSSPDPWAVKCYPDYSPLKDRLLRFVAGGHYERHLFFARNNAPETRYSPDQLRQARIAIRTYTPVEHFRRQITFTKGELLRAD